MRPPPPSDAGLPKEPLPRSVREVPGFLRRLLGNFFRRLFYTIGLVWETRRWILLSMLALSLLNGVLPVVGAYLSAQLLNLLAEAYVSPETVAFAWILELLAAQFVYLFLRSVTGTVQTMVSRMAGELVVNHIRVKIMQKAREIDLSSFDLPDFYTKLENANREAGMRPIQILNATFTVISTLISVVSFVAILWAVNPLAPVVIVLLSLPAAIVSFVYRKKYFQYMRRRSKERRQLTYFSDLMVDKDRVKEIRIFDLADTFSVRYNAIFQKYFAGIRRLFRNEGLWNTLLSLASVAVNCLLFLYIAYKVYHQELQVGDYSLYTGALNSIITGVASLIATTTMIYEGTLFTDNLIAFMREEKHLVPLADPPLPVRRHTGHTIRFEDVSFRYPGTERDVLSHINLSIDAGETVMLVGLNGAGKTTLIKLLTRLYDPTGGRILLDGRDIRLYDVQQLYSLFGILFQDFGKYAVTVSENISFGEIHKPADPAAVRQAAVESDADSFIGRLPQGYDTPLMRYFEDDGIELSIGQWQKLSVARAFYSDADILILDEPTASLDPLAEQEIYRQFDELRRDKTTLLVSHRLSSALSSSKIVVLDNGAVAEEGTHAQLMARRGVYYTLFTTQASRYREPAGENP